MKKFEKSELEKFAEDIQAYLEITMSEEPAEVQERGTTLSVYMAQTGKMLADAKYWKDKATKESILKRLEIQVSPSTLNKLVESDCEDENYLVNWIERINRTCTHQMDWCRSMLSKLKEEMKYQNWQ